MNQFSSPLPSLEVGMRWAARVLTVFLVGIVLLFLIGAGGFNRFTVSPVEAVMATLLVTTCIGMLIAWRWSFIGGVIVTSSILLYYAVDVLVRGGRFLTNPFFDLMLLAGILFMASALIKRHNVVS
jgi:hypothetical protein